MSIASTTRQGALVGCFTLIGVVILIAAVFTIGSMNDAFSSKIGISATFEQVDGLKKGDSVWFSGVPVGTVRQVAFKKGPVVQIDMALDANTAPFIPAGVKAQVSSDGLIGNKIIVLAGGEAGGESLKDGDTVGVETALSVAQLMDEVRATNEKLSAIATDVKTVTGKIANGEGSIGKLLADDALYADVQTSVTSLKRASGRADRISGDVATFTAQLNRDGNLPHEIVTDTTSYPKVQAAVASLEGTAADAAKMMDGIEEGMTDATTPVGVLLHDREAGGDLGQTFDNLERSTKLLEEDLEALQHNFLLRGYFKKQERKKRKAEKKAKKGK